MVAGDRLSVIFAALADPTRRAILARLAEGDATVMELAEPFSISLPAISRHLKVLEHAVVGSELASFGEGTLTPCRGTNLPPLVAKGHGEQLAEGDLIVDDESSTRRAVGVGQPRSRLGDGGGGEGHDSQSLANPMNLP